MASAAVPQFAAENAVAQICREGGARVSTNVTLRDLDMSPPRSDGRRFWKCWLKGCVLHGDGTHARRSKEATNPELCRGDGRARLVVMAGEVGGRWSQETKDFLLFLACEKSKSSRSCCKAAPELAGAGGGVVSLRVQQRRRHI